MPTVLLDGLSFSGLSWTYKLPPCKHKDRPFASTFLTPAYGLFGGQRLMLLYNWNSYISFRTFLYVLWSKTLTEQICMMIQYFNKQNFYQKTAVAAVISTNLTNLYKPVSWLILDMIYQVFLAVQVPVHGSPEAW